MKIRWHLTTILVLALASCGSTRTGVYKPAPLPQDTLTVKVPPADSISKRTPSKTKKGKNYGPFKVSLLLPLNITDGTYEMDDLIADYYEGVMMGLDSLKKMGMEVDVNVYDTKDDTALIRKITWKKELAESDVIIGPTFKSGHAMLSKYVQPRKIALVSPFSNANMWTDSNYYALYCSPDDKSYAAALAQYIKNNHPAANLLLFNDNTKEDKDFIWRFKVAAKEAGLEKWTDITYLGGWNIAAHLKSDTNIIIAPTDNEKISLQLLTQLKDPAYTNMLFVLDSWLEFENTNYQTYQLWQQNHLHVLTPYFVDDYNTRTVNFKAAYKNRYSKLPGEFAYRGYDQVMALGNLYLNGQQDNFSQNAETGEYKGLHNNFKFRFNGRALENRSVNIIEFSDYRFHLVAE